MIQLKKVSFSYGATPILQNLSVTLPQQGVVGFSGPSGCGKTTLLRILAGLEQPQSGTLSRPENCRLSMVFQEDRLLPWLTAEENVRLVCEAQPHRAAECLQAVGLSEAAHHYPDQLSGGMKRRVALARAMAADGDILILDEPFTGLDTALQEEIAALLREQFKDKLILLVTHGAEEFALFHCTPITLTAPLTGEWVI